MTTQYMTYPSIEGILAVDFFVDGNSFDNNESVIKARIRFLDEEEFEVNVDIDSNDLTELRNNHWTKEDFIDWIMVRAL